MGENKNKFILILARLMILAFIVFACTHTKDIEPLKLPEMQLPMVATESEVLESSEETSIQETMESTTVTKTSETFANKKVADVVASEKIYPATRSKIDKFVFVGDVYFSGKVKNAYDEKGIDGIIDNNYKTMLLTSDFAMANLECAITDGSAMEADKEYNLFTPERYVVAFKELGFKLFTLANNHVLDYGKEILKSTMHVLSVFDIPYIGAGKDINEAKKCFIKEIEGKKYAIFSASAVIPNDDWKASETEAGVNNGYDIASVCIDIRDIRKSVDKIIVYMHWGDELSGHSNEEQRALAHKLVDFGADLVIGSHPHVTQEVEYYKDTPIIYSLGNFIYGSTQRETMLLEATFTYDVIPEGFLQLRIYPGISNYEKVSSYWQEEEVTRWCKELQDKCETCYIANNGYVFTIDAVNKVLGLGEYANKDTEDENIEEN